MLMPRRLPILAAMLGLAACTQSAPLYIANKTVVGVNASVNSTQTSGSLIIGYDRVFVTNPPRSVVVTDGKDAMSVLSCSELTVKGIFLTGFTEHLATGDAAKSFAAELAKDPTKDLAFFKCATVD